jgi:hypothetical protein
VTYLLFVWTPTGETWNYERSLAYSRAGFEQVERTILISNTFVKLVACADRATATVLQQWSRMQRIAGAVRRLDTMAVQDETWVRTPGGWLRRYIGEVRQGVAFIDGKPVDLGRPFDPNAPPFDPHAPR